MQLNVKLNLTIFVGLSESFFDGDDLARIGHDGLYGANAPKITDQQTKVIIAFHE